MKNEMLPEFGTIINCADLAGYDQHPDWRIIDCRFALSDTELGRHEYRQAHIPGAIYAHLDEDLSGPIIPGKTSRHPLPDVERLVDTFSGWGIDSSVQVIAYDNGPGMIAARLWWMLRWLGHDRVAVLDGGWPAWLAAGYDTSDSVGEVAKRKFIATIRHEMLVDAAGVMDIIETDNYRLLDSRAAARYRGEVEPLDPIAGHIPSAVSAPYEDNLDEDQRLLAPRILRERFQELAGDIHDKKTVFYCGSGVSACQNLLAWHHAGCGEAILYAGSWSEWITDPNRPIVNETQAS